jgi:opacity protein-like surface antigen
MMTPSWILDILAGVMLLVAATSAGRLVVARSWAGSAREADIDVAHLLMGIAMAGMLVAGLTTLPNGVWDGVFAVLTAWFGWRVYRESRGEGVRVLADGHRMPHLVHSAAMLYMFAALNAPAATGGGGGMSGMGASGASMPTLSVPVVAFIFALWLSVYVVLDLDRLSGPGHAHGSYFAVPALVGAAAGTGSVNLAAASAAPVLMDASQAPVPGHTTGGSHPAGGGGSLAAGSPSGSARAVLLSPQLAAGCRIAMGVTMAFMLIIMI